MGHMKRIEQMVRDGSFDSEFMPAYNKAVDNEQISFVFGGSEIAVEYADVVVSFVEDLRRQ